MIIQLEGIIKFKTDKFVVVGVNGVGYRVFVPLETLRTMPKKESKISLWTHFHVRENAQDLYGFLEYAELEFFEKLIQVSGIGPKSAMAVLAVAPIDALKKAIISGETSYLTKVSGVGQRLADKIILELKNKLGGLSDAHQDGIFREKEDALEALHALGYSMRESRDALRRLPEDIKGTGNIIKEALKSFNKK